MSMPMHITPIPKEQDEFTIDEPLFLKLSLSKSNSTVPKAMIKTRTSIKKTSNLFLKKKKCTGNFSESVISDFKKLNSFMKICRY